MLGGIPAEHLYVYSQPHGFSGVHRQGSQVQFLHVQCGFVQILLSDILVKPPLLTVIFDNSLDLVV